MELTTKEINMVVNILADREETIRGREETCKQDNYPDLAKGWAEQADRVHAARMSLARLRVAVSRTEPKTQVTIRWDGL